MFFSAVSLFGVLASRLTWLNLSPLSCGAVLLERGCVSLGIRASSAMRFHGVRFEDSVFQK